LGHFTGVKYIWHWADKLTISEKIQNYTTVYVRCVAGHA